MKFLKLLFPIVICTAIAWNSSATVLVHTNSVSNGDTIEVFICIDEDINILAPSGGSGYTWYASSILLTQGSPTAVGGGGTAHLKNDTCLELYSNFLVLDVFTFIYNPGTGNDTTYIKVTYENFNASSAGGEKLNAGPDRAECSGGTVELYPIEMGDSLTAKWLPKDTITDTLQVTNNGWYELYGCRAGLSFIPGPMGCCMRDSIRVTFSTPPTVSTNGNSTICYGDSVQVTTSVTDTNAGASVTWFGDVSDLNATSIYDPLIKPTAAGIRNYKIIVTENSPAGCKDSAEFQVDMLPSFNAGILFTDSTVCASDTLQLTSTPTGGSQSGISYQWYSLAPMTALSTNSTHQINGTLTPTQYLIEVTDDQNCFVRSDTITLTPTDLDVTNTTPGGLYNLGICEGSGATMCVAGTGGTPPYSYLWYSDDSPNDNLSNPNDSCTLSTHGENIDYYARVTDQGGCFVEDTFYLEVTDLPFVLLPSTDQTVCLGDTVKIIAEASGGIGSGYIFDWNLSFTGFDTLISDTTDTACFIKTDGFLNNDIRVSVTDGFGCTSTVDVMTMSGVIKPSANPELIKSQEIIFADTSDNDQFNDANLFNNYWTNVAFNSNASDFASLSWVLEDSLTGFQEIVSSDINISDTTFQDPGSYNMILRLIAEQSACSVEYDLPFQVIEKSSAYVYNVITPDGDDYNGYLHIDNLDYFNGENTLVVFNRWGSELFRAENYNNVDNQFTGDDLPDGTYFYYLAVEGDPQSPHKGSFMIIR